MDKKEKLQLLLKGADLKNDVFFRPILMHFAARYIGKTYLEFATDYKVLVESNLKCLEDFDIDAVGLISDPYREASAFGAKIFFPQDNVPQCRNKLINKIEDIKQLKNPNVFMSVRTRDRIKAAEALKRHIGNFVPIIGWIEGPLAEGCDLAGVNEILIKILLEPDFIKYLLEKTLKTAKDFAKAQIEAGCDIIGIGDAICSQISVENYNDYVKELHKDLIKYIHSLGALVKLHICGNISHLLNDIREINPDIVDLDSMVDMENAYKILGENIIRCGNLNPVTVIEQSTVEEINKEVKKLCKKEQNRKFILSGGCEITVNTPSEHLKALRKASKI